jgi:uncharacterized protein (TIGR02145 family)
MDINKPVCYAKRLILMVLICNLFMTCVFPQVPMLIHYQAVLRDGDGKLIFNQQVGIRIQIKEGSIYSEAEFVETHQAATNENGLVSLEIGTGTAIIGSLADIDWSLGPYYLQTDVDPAGGSDYSITGINRILSVPTALHAVIADSLTGTISENDPLFQRSLAKSIAVSDTINWNGKMDMEKQNLSDVLKIDNDSRGQQIKNLAIPNDDQDVATKAYVDFLITKKADLEEMILRAGLYTIKDMDSNIYHAIRIGNRLWLAENLKTTRYNDGQAIAHREYNGEDSSVVNTPAYYWYNNNETNKNPYGALYTYAAVATDKLCPSGWHVPDNDDWDSMAESLGGDSLAGGLLKEAGTTHWNSPNTGADNESGFTGLPGGMLNGEGAHASSGFGNMGVSGNWWSGSTVGNSGMIYFLNHESRELEHFNPFKTFVMSVRCTRDDEISKINIPVIITLGVSEVYQHVATCGGTIFLNDGPEITAKGVCWSTDPSPDTSDAKTYDGYGSALFTSYLTNLEPNTTYYARAYAINRGGAAYGEELTFTTLEELPYGRVSDIEGHTYKTIVIGTQEWMAENLKTATYSNGEPIQQITNNWSWSQLTGGAWCDYNNDPTYSKVYGKLYNWYAAADERNVCPAGWHVPTGYEWQKLNKYFEYDAAGPLKERGTVHWKDPNIGATNESGFTAIPAPFRFESGNYLYEFNKDIGFWWSSSLSGQSQASSSYIVNNSTWLNFSTMEKNRGFSVRCLKD